MESRKAEDILHEVIVKAIKMNTQTRINKDLDNQVKAVHSATVMSILEPAFDYMVNTGDEGLEKIVEVYKQELKYFHECGLLTHGELEEADAKDNSSS